MTLQFRLPTWVADNNINMTIQAILFDAYGTLFDVYSVSVLAEHLFPGKGDALATLLRDKQIDYTRLRTMSGQYKPFWQVTEDALVYSCKKLGLALTPEKHAALMAQYAVLPAFPDSVPVLQQLRQCGLKLGILSNGNTAMLESVVQAAAMVPLLDHVISVDRVRMFKTAPQAYQLGPDTFGLAAKEILFVSSNCWDACGAAWFGFQTFWVNRARAPLEELDVTPDAQGHSLNDLVSYLQK